MRWLVALHGGTDEDGVGLAAQAVRTARLARDHGYDGVVAGQHFLTAPRTYLQPLPLLSRLVPETGNMDLVAGVLLFPFLHPVQLAEDLGTVDALSGGRLVIGVGQGYREVEFEAFGVDPSRRLRVQLAHLDALLNQWSSGRTGQQPGLGISPTQRPHPPVWYAAGGPKPFARAVHRGLIPFIGPQLPTAEVIRLIRDGVACPEVALRRDVLVTDVTGPDRADRLLAEHTRRYAAWGYTTAEAQGSPYVVGDADSCRAQIDELGDAGVTQVVVRTNWPGVTAEESRRMLAVLRA